MALKPLLFFLASHFFSFFFFLFCLATGTELLRRPDKNWSWKFRKWFIDVYLGNLAGSRMSLDRGTSWVLCWQDNRRMNWITFLTVEPFWYRWSINRGWQLTAIELIANNALINIFLRLINRFLAINFKRGVTHLVEKNSRIFSHSRGRFPCSCYLEEKKG